MTDAEKRILGMTRPDAVRAAVLASILIFIGIGMAIGYGLTSPVHITSYSTVGRPHHAGQSASVQLGDLAEWLAAIGTVGAFIFAAVVYQRDLKARRNADRESQARLFDAWIEELGWENPPTEDRYERGDSTLWHLRVEVRFSNASTQSMRDVEVRVALRGIPLLPIRDAGVISPTSPAVPYPSQSYYFEQTDGLRAKGNLAMDVYRTMLTLTLSFTDASGNRWTRNDKGELRFRYNLAERSRRAP